MNKISIAACLSMALFAGHSLADTEASQDFQWSGVVPSESTSDTWKIYQALNSPDFLNGTVKFGDADETTGVRDVETDTLSFYVADVATGDVSPESYTIELNRLTSKLSSDLVPVDARDDYALSYLAGSAAAEELSVGDSAEITNGSDVVGLNVATISPLDFTAGEDLTITASLLVTDVVVAP